MRVVSAAQMQALEATFHEQLGLPLIVLMELAGLRVARAAAALYQGQALATVEGLRALGGGWQPGPRPRGDGPIVIVAGTGNNGGDALVAARHLFNWGLPVVIVSTGVPKGDARQQWQAAQALGIPVGTEEHLAQAALIIDGLLGTGVQGPVVGPVAELIEAINRAGKPVLAIDLPSGLLADSGLAPGAVVAAQATLTLGQPKLGLFLGRGPELTGQLWLGEIGLPPAPRGGVTLSEPAEAEGWVPGLVPQAHKGSRGHLLVIGGSVGMVGAPALTARAALRTGAGVVRLVVPAPLRAEAAVLAGPGVMVVGAAATEAGAFAPGALPELLGWAEAADAVALGPGLGRGVAPLVRALVEQLRCPMVLDADGLRAFAGRLSDLAGRPLLLTPHPGEMAALLGSDSSAAIQADRLGALQAAIRQAGVAVLLKGAYTLIGDPNDIYINPTGNPLLATAGSGDVLTGVAGALLAQGLPPLRAGIVAALRHGAAADRYLAEQGQGLTASTLIDWL